MELAVVVGQVVSTVKCSGFSGDRLLLIDFIEADGKPQGSTHVAADGIGAGTGEWVLVVQGSSARKTLSDDVPVDMSVVGIVDEVVLGDRVTYHK
jgi:ethanolamine utilization protein EutN